MTVNATIHSLTPPLVVAVWLAAAGCGTPDVNPQQPRLNTGYVDFYTDSAQGLSWRVKRANERTGEMRTEFSEFKPPSGNILRLAVPEGTHRFEIWFGNQVTTGPQPVVVQVVNGKVTPVHVTLTPAGSVAVDNKSYVYRPTPLATRRVGRVVSEQQTLFQLGAVAGSPGAYQPKERMPYCSKEQ